MRFPDRIVPASGGQSCIEIFKSKSALSPAECELHRHFTSGVVDVLAFCGCTNGTTRSVCSHCGAWNPDTIMSRDRTIEGPALECSPEFSEAVSLLLNPKLCKDLQAFAGNRSCCVGTTAGDSGSSTQSTFCSMCGNESVALINDEYPLRTKEGFTCRNARDMAPFFTEESNICQDQIQAVAPGCCTDENRCSLCSKPSSKIRFPNRKFPFAPRTSLSCIDVEFELGFLNEKLCDKFLDAVSSVDVGTWCGCEDEEPSRNVTCSLCGPDLELVEESLQIENAPAGITCLIIEIWAPFVQDQTFCDSHVTLLRDQCCGQPGELLLPHPVLAANDPAPELTFSDFGLASSSYTITLDGKLRSFCLITVWALGLSLTLLADTSM